MVSPNELSFSVIHTFTQDCTLDLRSRLVRYCSRDGSTGNEGSSPGRSAGALSLEFSSRARALRPGRARRDGRGSDKHKVTVAAGARPRRREEVSTSRNTTTTRSVSPATPLAALYQPWDRLLREILRLRLNDANGDHSGRAPASASRRFEWTCHRGGGWTGR